MPTRWRWCGSSACSTSRATSCMRPKRWCSSRDAGPARARLALRGLCAAARRLRATQATARAGAAPPQRSRSAPRWRGPETSAARSTMTRAHSIRSSTTDMPCQRVLDDLFEGLVTLSVDGRPVPGAAASWQRSADGRTWVFHLRPDARWSNGAPVTADDFVYSWRREVDPRTGSRLRPGARAHRQRASRSRSGSMPPETLGVEAMRRAHADGSSAGADAIPARSARPATISTLCIAPAIERYGDDWVAARAHRRQRRLRAARGRDRQSHHSARRIRTTGTRRTCALQRVIYYVDPDRACRRYCASLPARCSGPIRSRPISAPGSSARSAIRWSIAVLRHLHARRSTARAALQGQPGAARRHWCSRIDREPSPATSSTTCTCRPIRSCRRCPVTSRSAARLGRARPGGGATHWRGSSIARRATRPRTRCASTSSTSIQGADERHYFEAVAAMLARRARRRSGRRRGRIQGADPGSRAASSLPLFLDSLDRRLSPIP